MNQEQDDIRNEFPRDNWKRKIESINWANIRADVISLFVVLVICFYINISNLYFFIIIILLYTIAFKETQILKAFMKQNI